MPGGRLQQASNELTRLPNAPHPSHTDALISAESPVDQRPHDGMTGRQSSEGIEPASVVLPINSLLGLNDDHELAKVLLFEPVRA